MHHTAASAPPPPKPKTEEASPPPKPKTEQAPPPPAGIPQGNGGDHDIDNNGGPSDGDGNI
jgi:hypothetical protein